MTLSTFMSACSDEKTVPPPLPETGLQRAVSNNVFLSLTDAWIGEWHGPEGTMLNITGAEGKYTIEITNLDGPKTYQGKSTNNRIVFMRDGKEKQIQATDGLGTGMKWLSEKTNCLTIQSGEGFCRD
ncbi:MAG: hypothetical protein B7X95_09570 [Methylophilaceae bacterium 17-44-8]|nr:MAG: hypothetical protein B7X95_09570 [Methylophilaceae bacterium 17-44-8]